ncbi:hypothetical protein GGR54DRAFT_635817 [Hypoxylon sp. NC1633]|nr:hypothetical protein GGR54DRAFT_635817 [Hypoxylon sp. NC1633]
MQVTSIIASAIAFASLALASPVAVINVEAYSSGGVDPTNSTILAPVGGVYTNSGDLNKVSNLYLIGTTDGLAVERVYCVPYSATDGTGVHGLPFNSTTPSKLSTNTVVVGSIVCQLY